VALGAFTASSSSRLLQRVAELCPELLSDWLRVAQCPDGSNPGLPNVASAYELCTAEIDTHRKCLKMPFDLSHILEPGTAGRRTHFSLFILSNLVWILPEAGG
jgi:hypothetical protein